jgi:hypothetical protein
MANLITEKQKKIIITDYLFRILAVSFFILSFLGLYVLAYVIPYYIVISNENIKITGQFKSIISPESTGQNVLQVANQTLDEMKAIELYDKNNPVPSVYFGGIIEHKNPDIKITKLSFGLVKAGEGHLTVSGISKNRSGLVAFIESLKSVAGFASVDSPISDFVQDSDISFTLDIKTKI